MRALIRTQTAVAVLLLAHMTVAESRADVRLNELTAAEKRSGWRLLFDGKTTDGWRNYKQDRINDGWVVREGALTRSAQGAGDIVTVQQFDSFELQIEYRISRGGNSGIM